MTLRSVVTGTGSFLPDGVVTSEEIEQRLGMRPGFCADRLGIEERRVAPPGMASYHLGAEAARHALADAGLDANDVDYVLFHCTFSELHYPTPGVFLQRELGITSGAPVLEVKAACAAFVAMLDVADALIRAGTARRVLLVCGERNHVNASSLDASAPLIGDGGAAVVLEAAELPGDEGLIWCRIWTDASAADSCVASTSAWDLGQPDRFPELPELREAAHARNEDGPPRNGIHAHWSGMTIFRRAVRAMGSAVEQALEETGLDRDGVDHFLFHQANGKILASLLRQYRLPPERTPSNIRRYGNTSSATVPILLDEGLREDRIRPGQVVLMAAVGAGFTWGAVVYRVPRGA